MHIIHSVKKVQSFSRRLVAEGKSIGLVPTMGFLHEGHLSLIRRARKATDAVIVTIFVNPTQFGPSEDLVSYPRDERGDIRKIKVEGADAIFIPKENEIYPAGFQTFVTVEKLSRTLEGASRPNHFRGVSTIVAKLFNITRPDVAVFGMKDFQQAVVLRHMTRDLGYPVKIIIAPTVREKDGLAMSSRNSRLDDIGRWEALCLFYALRTAREMVKGSVTSTTRIEKEMREVILATCPTAEIDYIAFTNSETLMPQKKVVKNTICSLAVKVQGVRLIDNMKFA